MADSKSKAKGKKASKHEEKHTTESSEELEEKPDLRVYPNYNIHKIEKYLTEEMLASVDALRKGNLNVCLG